LQERGSDTRTLRLGLLAIVVITAVIFGLVELLGDDDSNGEGPVGLSESELMEKAGSFSTPVYWVGPRPGTDQYELTQTDDGRVYVRYLTGAAEVGTQTPSYLTVGTYPVAGAKKALRRSKQAGGTGELIELPDRDVLKGRSGQNVYVVLNTQPDLQIEIFDPTPGRALRLATEGALQVIP
jgi:hypothetical protein